MPGRFTPCLVVLSACLVATPAYAQAVPKQYIDLNYEVDPVVRGCPSAVEFRAIVAKELGYDPYRGGATMGLGVRVGTTSTGIEGTIDWSIDTDRRVGQRRFSAQNTDCRQMMTSMGFVVAVQLQLMANEQASEPAEPAGTGESNRSNNPPLDGELAHSSERAQSEVTLSATSFEVRPVPMSKGDDWTTMAGIGPSVGLGLAPTLVGQGRLFFGIQYKWVGFEFGAEASTTSTTRQAYGGGFQHELRLGTIAACAWDGPFAACGLAKLGRIQVQGIGVDVPTSPNGFIAQTGPRVAYALGLGDHLVLLGHIEALWLLTSWTVEANHLAVWTMPRIGAVAGIDLAARFR